MVRQCILAAGAALIAGCATVTYDSSQSVRVQTVSRAGQEIVGATCEAEALGPGAVLRSGAAILIPRSFDTLTLSCRAPGLPPAMATLVPMANWGMAGNMVIGGMAGLAVDHVKGSAYSYPAWIRMVFGEDRVYEQRLSEDDVPNLGVVRDAWAPETTQLTPTYNDGRPAVVLPRAPRVAQRVETGDSPSAADIARLQNIDGLPTAERSTRAAYSAWLARPLPRAFALSPKGDWAGAWGLRSDEPALPSDPAARALALCARQARTECQLYAVNSKVVWKP